MIAARDRRKIGTRARSGGELAGIFGIVFAVPALAVLRVLFDFFRANRTL